MNWEIGGNIRGERKRNDHMLDIVPSALYTSKSRSNALRQTELFQVFFTIYFCPCGLFTAACGLSLVAASGGCSLVSARTSLVSELGVWSMKSSVAVAHRFNCPTACGILVPQTRIELVFLHCRVDC